MVEDISNELIELAAVSGVINPKQLSQLVQTHQSLTPAHIRELATNCVEQRVGDSIGWVLKADLRQKTLSDLSDQEISSRIQQSKEISLKDEFGSTLQKVLQNKPVKLMKLDAEQRNALRIALEMSASRDEKNKQTSREIRRKIDLKQAENAFKVVAPEKLFGRDNQYSALLQLKRNGRLETDEYDASFTVPVDDIPKSIQPALLVTGIGGSGKSALLSTFAYKTRRWSPNAPLIYLDFDRPTLHTADWLQLLLEFSRQLGLQSEKLYGVMSKFRRELREINERRNAEIESTFSTTHTEMDGAFSLLLHTLTANEVRELPIVLILDTFEEILVKGEQATSNVFTWLDGMKSIAGLVNLRVVVSGRVAPNIEWDDVGNRFIGHIPLGDLDDKAGRALLQSFGHSKSRSKRAVEAFGANALVLMIFDRFTRGQPENSSEVEALIEAGLQNGGRLAGGPAQEFLYSRILGRIRDEDVKKLAHPGLVLRRVTADLIDAVLKTPCELENQEDFDAASLFDKLASQIWLVTRLSDHVVVHRKDLRHLMMASITSEMPKKARSIHQAAWDYYASYRDQWMDEESQRVEAAYHRLFVDDEFSFDEDFAARLIETVGADIEDYPLRTSARLKMAAGQISSLTDAERRELDDDAYETASRFKQQELSSSGANLEAQSLGEEINARLDQSSKFDFSPELDPPLATATEDITSAFNACDWQFFAERGEAILIDLLGKLDGSHAKENMNFVFSDWWRTALAIRASRVETDFTHFLSSTERYLNTNDEHILLPFNARKEGIMRFEVPLLVATAVQGSIVPGNRTQIDEMWEQSQTLRKRSPYVEKFVESGVRSLGRLRFEMVRQARFPDEMKTPLTVHLVMMRLFMSNTNFSVPASTLSNQNENWITQLIESQLDEDGIDLSRMEKVYSGVFDQYVSLNPGLFLDGPAELPEIHEPLRFAFETAIHEGFDMAAVTNQLNTKTRFWPRELKELQFEDRRTLTSRVPSIIMAADRTGLLRELCQSAHDQLPKLPILAAANSLVQSYEDLLAHGS